MVTILPPCLGLAQYKENPNFNMVSKLVSLPPSSQPPGTFQRRCWPVSPPGPPPRAPWLAGRLPLLPQPTSASSRLFSPPGHRWRPPPLHWLRPAVSHGQARAARPRAAPGLLLPARRPSWLHSHLGRAALPCSRPLATSPAVKRGHGGPAMRRRRGLRGCCHGCSEHCTVVDPTSDATGDLVVGAVAPPFPFGMPPWSPTNRMVGAGTSTNSFPTPPPSSLTAARPDSALATALVAARAEYVVR